MSGKESSIEAGAKSEPKTRKSKRSGLRNLGEVDYRETESVSGQSDVSASDVDQQMNQGLLPPKPSKKPAKSKVSQDGAGYVEKSTPHIKEPTTFIAQQDGAGFIGESTPIDKRTPQNTKLPYSPQFESHRGENVSLMIEHHMKKQTRELPERQKGTTLKEPVQLDALEKEAAFKNTGVIPKRPQYIYSEPLNNQMAPATQDVTYNTVDDELESWREEMNKRADRVDSNMKQIMEAVQTLAVSVNAATGILPQNQKMQPAYSQISFVTPSQDGRENMRVAGDLDELFNAAAKKLTKYNGMLQAWLASELPVSNKDLVHIQGIISLIRTKLTHYYKIQIRIFQNTRQMMEKTNKENEMMAALNKISGFQRRVEEAIDNARTREMGDQRRERERQNHRQDEERVENSHHNRTPERQNDHAFESQQHRPPPSESINYNESEDEYDRERHYNASIGDHTSVRSERNERNLIFVNDHTEYNRKSQHRSNVKMPSPFAQLSNIVMDDNYYLDLPHPWNVAPIYTLSVQDWTHTYKNLHNDVFSGEIFEYPIWRGTFITTVHMAKISILEKYKALKMSVPKDVILDKRIVPGGNGYRTIIMQLEETYGMETEGYRAIAQEILNWKSWHPWNWENFLKARNGISNYASVAPTYANRDQAENDPILLKVLNCIPPDVGLRFQENCRKNTFVPSIHQLSAFFFTYITPEMKFLKKHSYNSSFIKHKEKDKKEQKKENKPSGYKIFTVKELADEKKTKRQKFWRKRRVWPICPTCKPRRHDLPFCKQFRKLTPQQRKTKVDEWKFCYRCVGPDHNSKDCKSNEVCLVCAGTHNTLLHGCKLEHKVVLSIVLKNLLPNTVEDGPSENGSFSEDDSSEQAQNSSDEEDDELPNSEYIEEDNQKTGSSTRNDNSVKNATMNNKGNSESYTMSSHSLSKLTECTNLHGPVLTENSASALSTSTNPCGAELTENANNAKIFLFKKLGNVLKDGNEIDLTQGSVSKSINLLQILPVRIYRSDYKYSKLIYALLDSGANLTLIAKSLAKDLNLKGHLRPIKFEIFGKKDNKLITMETTVRLQKPTVHPKATPTYKINALTAENILEGYNECEWETINENLEKVQELPPEVWEPSWSKLEMVIGTDNAALLAAESKDTEIMSRGVVTFVRNTILGKVPFGAAGRSNWNNTVNCLKSFESEVDSNLPPGVLSADITENVRSCPCIKLSEVVDKYFSSDVLTQEQQQIKESVVDWTEKYCLDLMEKTMRQTEDNRYEISCLWKPGEERPKNNFKQAIKRLASIKNKFQRDPEYEKKYRACVQVWIDNGYARILDEAPDEEQEAYYSPHFAVVREEAETTKMRVVLDGKAGWEAGESLNDYQWSGPKLINDLQEVLLKFRRGKYAFACDVSEMFLRIKLLKKDLPYHRFLWYTEEGKLVQIQMLSHIFGSAGSPAIAQFVVRRHATKYAKQFPDAVSAVQHRSIVDDILCSFDEQEKAKQVLHQLIQIFKECGMILHKISSNSKELLDTLKPEQISKKQVINEDGVGGELGALGLTWDASTDSFQFSRSPNLKTDITKRSTLGNLMTLFDPLRVLSPFLMKGKILYQDLWHQEKTWDEPLLDVEKKRWKTWYNQWDFLKSLKYPRCINNNVPGTQFTIFSDASQDAYGACAYISEPGQIPQLIQAIGHVRPKRIKEIPKLELMGAVSAISLARVLRRAWGVKTQEVTFFTDNASVMYWLKRAKRGVGVFVSNRINKISRVTSSSQWMHVESERNPADLISKGMKLKNLSHSTLWWNGPNFLLDKSDLPDQNKFKFPQDAIKVPDISNLAKEIGLEDNFVVNDTPSLHPETVTTLHEPVQQGQATFKMATPLHEAVRTNVGSNVSSETTKMVTALKVLQPQLADQENTILDKALQNSKKVCLGPIQPIRAWAGWGDWERAVFKMKSLVMTVTFWKYRMTPEVKHKLPSVKTLLFRQSQLDSWGGENQKDLPKTNKELNEDHRFRKMEVFWDDRVIRIRSRIAYESTIPFSTRNPILLHHKDPIAKAYVKFVHESITMHHPSASLLRQLLRREIHITHFSKVCSQIIKECVKCRRVRKQSPTTPKMAPLPSFRLPIGGARVFQHVGFDAAGPFKVKVLRRTVSRHIILFNCLLTRAIHLEKVEDLSTKSMLLAFERFIARRGRPTLIFCDNAPSFLQLEDLQKKSLDKLPDIEWKHIPPNAPHHGGVYERLVRSMKQCLEVVQTRRDLVLTEEEFETYMIRAEDLVNQRPLVASLEGVNDNLPLSPADFLMTGPRAPLLDIDMAGPKIASSYLEVQAALDLFWRELMVNLMSKYSERSKWFKSKGKVKVGDLVVVLSNKNARGVWPIAKIESINVGKDGIARSVWLRIGYKLHCRSVHSLAPLINLSGEEIRELEAFREELKKKHQLKNDEERYLKN